MVVPHGFSLGLAMPLLLTVRAMSSVAFPASAMSKMGW